MNKIKYKNIKLVISLVIFTIILTGCNMSQDFTVASLTSDEESDLILPDQYELPVHQDARFEPYTELDGSQYYFKAGSKYLSAYNGTDFKNIYIKGVNMGLGNPGHNPGEAAIPKSDYIRWISQIAAMGSNCIRVYTIQPPSFYEALYEYNKSTDSPIYLMQGTWYDENIMLDSYNAFDERLTSALQVDSEHLVDIIHGNCSLEPQPGKAYGTYSYDISPYVIGWILGIESDPEFVKVTNELNPDVTSYSGRFLVASKLQPFEVFWARTGDEILRYEMDHYSMQRPLSFTNCPDTDALNHPSDISQYKDEIALNIEHIKPTYEYHAGLFAAYHVYPYYPTFISTDLDYKSYTDNNGDKNPYKAYLTALKDIHNIPIVVAEYGLPSSRGMSHIEPVMGYNQGNLNEDKQAEYVSHMTKDIYETGLAGGIVFTWQDEWFKTSWNTKEHTDQIERALWSDVMTPEEHYGMLEFISGAENKHIRIDGLESDWNKGQLIGASDKYELYADSDNTYMYFMVKALNGDIKDSEILIPIDTTPFSGSETYKEIDFDRGIDFIIDIDGKTDSNMFVQSYYDSYAYIHGDEDPDITPSTSDSDPDTTNFNSIYYKLDSSHKLPDRDETLPYRKFDAGHLVFGKETEDSLADFYYDKNILEIRIPWLMLGFRNPVYHNIEADFRSNGSFSSYSIDSIYIGCANTSEQKVQLLEYTLKDLEGTPYYEHLTKLYYKLSELYPKLTLK